MPYLLISGYYFKSVQPLNYSNETMIRKVIIGKMRLNFLSETRVDIAF